MENILQQIDELATKAQLLLDNAENLTESELTQNQDLIFLINSYITTLLELCINYTMYNLEISLIFLKYYNILSKQIPLRTDKLFNILIYNLKKEKEKSKCNVTKPNYDFSDRLVGITEASAYIFNKRLEKYLK